MSHEEPEIIQNQESLHDAGSADLHFRYTGVAKDRTFVVNIQFDKETSAGDVMQPIEYSFMVTKILAAIIKRLQNSPGPNLH